MKNYQDFKNELLSDTELKIAYNKLDSEYELATNLIRKRLEKGITQAELAKAIHTKQSAISRLESGNYNPSINFLTKVAKALNCKIKVNLE